MAIELVELGAQLFRRALVRLHNGGLKVDRKAEAQHRLNENAQRLDVNIGGENLAEIDFQPSNKRRVLTLLLLNELITITFARFKRLLIVNKVANDEPKDVPLTMRTFPLAATQNSLSFSTICFILVDNLLEECHCIERILLILSYAFR